MGSRRPRFPDMFQQHLRMHRPGPEKPQTPKEISAGKQQIVVMIAHRLSTIMHADRIYVLEKGKIIENKKQNLSLNNKSISDFCICDFILITAFINPDPIPLSRHILIVRLSSNTFKFYRFIHISLNF